MNPAEAIETYFVAAAVFAFGAAMVFMDVQGLPPQTRKMLTLWTSTDRSRKRLGMVFMAFAVLVVLSTAFN